jgi:hypothetical protein
MSGLLKMVCAFVECDKCGAVTELKSYPNVKFSDKKSEIRFALGGDCTFCNFKQDAFTSPARKGKKK